VVEQVEVAFTFSFVESTKDFVVEFAVTMEGKFLKYYFTNSNWPFIITIEANEWQPSPTKHLADFGTKHY
jgi:hypothetical protein